MDTSDNFTTHKRVLCEVQDNQKYLHELCKAEGSDEPCTDAKIQCVHAQGKFANLKLDFIDLQTKTKLLNYLENVPQEEWGSAGVSAEEFKVAHRDLKKTKEEMRDREEQLQELITKANTAQEEFESKLKLLQSKVECIEQKRNRLADLKAEHSERLSGVSTGINMDNFETQLSQQTEALQKIEVMLPMYQNTIAGLEQEITKMAAAKKATEMLLEEVRPNMERLKAEREDEMSKKQWMTTWCKNALEKLSHLSGIKEHSIHGNKLTLELLPPGDSPVTGLLTLHFSQGRHPSSSWQLHNAELNIESLDIADIVQEAVRLNDAVFLVTQVKTRLYSHAPLRHEVEALRHRYALDWLSDEGLIRVMLGDKGQVVCSLTIESGYPAVGSIKLTAVEGLQEQRTLESLKPATESPTITDWLDHLHNTINDG